MEKPTTQEYAQNLRRHDWWYMMSDSSSVWGAGRKREQELVQMAENDPELQGLFDLACAYHRSNGTIEVDVAECWLQQYLLAHDAWLEVDELPITQPRNKRSAYPDSWVVDWLTVDRMLRGED